MVHGEHRRQIGVNSFPATYYGYEEPHVSLREFVADEIVLSGQDVLCFIERLKDLGYCFQVCLLRCSKTRTINPI